MKKKHSLESWLLEHYSEGFIPLYPEEIVSEDGGFTLVPVRGSLQLAEDLWFGVLMYQYQWPYEITSEEAIPIIQKWDLQYSNYDYTLNFTQR